MLLKLTPYQNASTVILSRKQGNGLLKLQIALLFIHSAITEIGPAVLFIKYVLIDYAFCIAMSIINKLGNEINLEKWHWVEMLGD